jgi:predicted PurR-regulated permease PerM
VIPQLATAYKAMVVSLPGVIEKSGNYFSSLSFEMPEWLSFMELDFSSIEQNVVDVIKTWTGAVVESSVQIAQGFVQSIITFSLAFVFAIYMLLKKERLLSQLDSIVKAYLPTKRYESLAHTGKIISSTFSRFISTMAVEAIILGSMFLITMLIFQFPYAFLISSLVAVAAFIPIVGAFIAAFIGILLMLVTNPIQALWFTLLFLALQQIEGNIIYPRVVGDSIGLPGIWVLFAVVVGGNIFGILGIFLGVPFVAVVYVLIRENVKKRLLEKS